MNPLIRYECEHCPASFTVREEYEKHYVLEHESMRQLLIEAQDWIAKESDSDDAIRLLQRIDALLAREEKRP